MFQVNGIPILAEPLQVLQELKNQLALQGIERFAVFKEGTRNIQFNCPIHHDGQEKKPSCGITTGENNGTPAGIVHCFSCGYTASFEEMISHCYGIDDSGTYGRSWLIKNFISVSQENRREIVFDVVRNLDSYQSYNYVAEEELARYRFYHPYMWKRKLTKEVIELFDVGYDHDFTLTSSSGTRRNLKCLTFPVRDETGQTLFVARRSVDYKLFHYPQGVEKPVYGLYELSPGTDTVIVCESFINALTCWVHGRPAIALLGLGTEHQYDQLKRLQCRKFILAFDPDSAGNVARIKFRKALGKCKIITEYVLPKGKDINDLTFEEFESLIEIF